MSKSFYITTPIYYVNGVPHIGTATTTILCDAFARWHRLRGEPTFFLTGTDEHAQKVADAALKAGKTPQQFVDDISQRFVECWRFLDISNDDFIRTSEPRHKVVVEEVFRRLQSRGDIYTGQYEGWYSVADETFYRNSDVEDGRAKETGATVERVTEQNYYFRLSAYADPLLAHIEAHPDFLLPDTRRNEAVAFIKAGLRDIPISRRNTGWGIPAPGDSSQTVYVWFDACINYLTATGWPDSPLWDTLWPADIHLVGKEIYTRFHATLWPAMLMALGLPLPGHVLGHGWWLAGGEKGAKSKGNIPTPQEAVTELQARSGAAEAACVDALRCYLLRDIKWAADAEWSLDTLIETYYNAELANNLGNLLNRTLKMLWQYRGGIVPNGAAQRTASGSAAQAARESAAEVAQAMDALDPGSALGAALRLADRGNKQIDTDAPWKANKAGESERVDDALYAALETLRVASVLLTPFLPHTARAIREQLGVTETAAWADTQTWGLLPGGTQTQPAQPIFPRIETTTARQEKTIPVTEPASAPPTPPTNLITIDDFAKIELKVAEILTAERIEGATKLLKLTVNCGEDAPRQILAGIAENHEPSALVGKKIVVVANLQPRKMRGLESQGMLLAATDSDGHAILLHPESDVAPGAKVR